MLHLPGQSSMNDSHNLIQPAEIPKLAESLEKVTNELIDKLSILEGKLAAVLSSPPPTVGDDAQQEHLDSTLGVQLGHIKFQLNSACDNVVALTARAQL